jgi:hypothetical protein
MAMGEEEGRECTAEGNKEFQRKSVFLGSQSVTAKEEAWVIPGGTG